MTTAKPVIPAAGTRLGHRYDVAGLLRRMAENGIHPYVMSSGTWWSHVMIMERALRY